jgi:very-short-patch-repair endonuclease
MSQAEEELAMHLRALHLPVPEREHRFCNRRWRFDFAWPAQKVAVEVDGGQWVNGRHNRPKGYQADCEKLAEAACLGWRVIRVTPDMIRSGQAVRYIERVMEVGDERSDFKHG